MVSGILQINGYLLMYVYVIMNWLQEEPNQIGLIDFKPKGTCTW